MILTLSFDRFCTTVKIPDVDVNDLEERRHKQFYKWLRKDRSATTKLGLFTTGYTYDDKNVIAWFKDEWFDEKDVEILESHISEEESKYTPDYTMYF